MRGWDVIFIDLIGWLLLLLCLPSLNLLVEFVKIGKYFVCNISIDIQYFVMRAF